MPGFLLDASTTILCAHQGQAKATAPMPRVKVGGQPVVVQPAPHVIGGCTFLPPNPGPCVVAQWMVGATRVKVMGQPVLLADSQAICTPTGTPVTIVAPQNRVKGI